MPTSKSNSQRNHRDGDDNPKIPQLIHRGSSSSSVFVGAGTGIRVLVCHVVVVVGDANLFLPWTIFFFGLALRSDTVPELCPICNKLMWWQRILFFVAAFFATCAFGDPGFSFERVGISPSSVFKAQHSWPNYNGVGCSTVAEEDAYLFSTNGYAYAQCHRLDRTLEAVRVNVSRHVSTSGLTVATVYRDPDCVGDSTTIETFLPMCRYYLNFDDSHERLIGNVHSVRVAEGDTLRLFSSCSANNAPVRTIVGDGSCVNVDATGRMAQLWILRDSPRVLRRVLVGEVGMYDHLLGQNSVGDVRVADNTVACDVSGDRVFVAVNDFRQCSDVPSSIVVFARDLAFERAIQVSNCPHLRDAVALDENTLILACAGMGHINGQSELRRLTLNTGTHTSLRLSEEITDAAGYTYTVVLNPIRLFRGKHPDEVIFIALKYATDVALGTVSGSEEHFGNENYTHTTFVDTFGPPDAAVYDADAHMIYLTSEHRLMVWDMQAMRVRVRDPVCGTNALEIPDIYVYGLVVDSNKGYVYAINSMGQGPSVVSVRDTGIEFEEEYPLRVDARTGYLHNLYPLQTRDAASNTWQMSNETRIFGLNISVLLSEMPPTAAHESSRSRMLLASKSMGATPPFLAIATARGCAVGTAGVSRCIPCEAGLYADTPGQRTCKQCAAGRHAGENESTTCADCAPGQYSFLNASLGCEFCAFGRFSNRPGSSACTSCPADHYHLVKGSTRATDCAPCAEGSVAERGSSSCEACPMGKRKTTVSTCSSCPRGYFGGSGAEECTPCPVGKFGTSNGSLTVGDGCDACPLGRVGTRIALFDRDECEVCVAGKYRGIGDATCIVCPPQSYSSTEGAEECVACPEGWKTVGEFRAECEACPVGMYGVFQSGCVACVRNTYSETLGAPGVSSCAPCPAGRHTATSGSASVSQCMACTYGKFLAEGASNCLPCPVGWIAAAEAAVACVACAPGKFETDSRYRCAACPAGMFQAAGEANTCDVCDPGTFADTASATSCAPCPAGFASDVATGCTACAAGTFQASEGASACNVCDPGTFADATSATSCAPCPAGYASASATACAACAVGTFQAAEGESACDGCDPGTFADTTSATSCAPCPAGYETSTTTECIACAPGRFKQPLGSGACTPCPAGRVSGAPFANTSAVCDVCPAGWWAASLTACTVCEAGKYGALASQTTESACMVCPKGTYGVEIGASALEMCTDCPAGRYGESVGAASNGVCKACDPGKYRSSPGAEDASDCLECVAGFASLRGKRRCSRCRKGQFSTQGATVCEACAEGKYNSEEGNSACGTCPADAEPFSDGTYCVCSAGMFTQNTSGVPLQCTGCPPHTICNKKNVELAALEVAPGYWRHANDSLEIRRCPEPGACVGGTVLNSTDSMCRTGHTGPMCAVCVEGYAKTGEGLCAECPPERADLNIAVTALAPIGLIAVVVVMIATANADPHASVDGNQFSGIMKITSSMLQVYTVCAGFDVKWPSILVTIFEKSDSLNPTLGFYSAECSIGYSFFQKSTIYMLMPIVYVVCSLVVVVVVSRCAARAGERREFVKVWAQTSVVVGLFLMYTSIVKNLFRGLACDRVGDAYFMSTDYSVQCFVGEHVTYIPAAVVCLILYGIGIPAVAVGLLWQWRFSLHDPGARALQFLHRGYRHKRFYWEVVVLARKVAVIAMSIFMFTGENMTRYQSPCASWFFVACLIVHLVSEPFDQLTQYGRVCSVLESSAICACICTLNAGIIFGTHTDDYNHGVFEGLVLVFTIIVNSVVAVLFGYHIAKSGWTKSKESIRKVLRACCFKQDTPEEDADCVNLPKRFRRGSLHHWVHEGDVMPESRRREIELEKRTEETAALDRHLRTQKSMKLKSIHAHLEMSQRERMFQLSQDSNRVHRALQGADEETAAAFRKDWKRQLDDFVAAMQLTPLNSVRDGSSDRTLSEITVVSSAGGTKGSSLVSPTRGGPAVGCGETKGDDESVTNGASRKEDSAGETDSSGVVDLTEWVADAEQHRFDLVL